MAFKVKFNSNGGEGTMLPFTFENNSGKLPKNEFTRSGFKFVGWADSKENAKVTYMDRLQFGKVKYENKDNVKFKGEGSITLYACWLGNGLEAACTWAMLIAADNSFMYGVGSRAHHNGCYFCGTNRTKKNASKGDKWDKTYCCNPFVGAALAHGMGMNKGKCWSTGLSQKSWENKGFKKISVSSVSKLLPGDLLLKPDKHIKIYVGNKKVAHAAQEGWTDKSIRVNSYNKIESGYIVMRYKNASSSIISSDFAKSITNKAVQALNLASDTVEEEVEQELKQKEKLIKKYGNEAKTYYYLRNLGWTHKGTCGVMGNINQESGFRTSAVSFDGYGSLGICQWTFGRKDNLLKFLAARNYSQDSLEGQCAFLDYETKDNYASLYKILTKSTKYTVAQIAEKFCWEWERPAEEYAHIENRVKSAETYDKRYGGVYVVSEIGEGSGANIDFNATTAKLVSSDNMSYLIQEQATQTTPTVLNKYVSAYKNAILSAGNIISNAAESVTKQSANLVELFVKNENKVENISPGKSTFSDYAKGSTLPIYQTVVEAPFGEITFGDIKFGTYNVYKNYNSYPNYVQSIDIVKTNGTLNEYTIQLIHQVAPGDNPNYVAEILSSVGYNEITISYGDANSGVYYQDIKALMTNVKTAFDFTNHVIRYTISASSLSYLTATTKLNFPSVKDKPSNVIMNMLKDESSFILDYFSGMKDIKKVIADGLIPTNDAEVEIEAVQNKNVIEYISYLVSLMKNENENLAENSTYYFVINDDVTENVGNTFKIKEVSTTSAASNALTYEVDLGYPDDNMAFDFSINTNYAWAATFENSLNIKNYNYDIDNYGNVQTREVSSLLNSDLSANSFDIDTNTWKQLTRFPISATLTVKGLCAPILLLTYIRVNNYYFGNKRITSGLYIITEQHDSISGNGCRTTLGLTRVASDIESISVDGRVRT